MSNDSKISSSPVSSEPGEFVAGQAELEAKLEFQGLWLGAALVLVVLITLAG